MTISVYDSTLTKTGLIDEYQSAYFTRSAFSPGAFEIVINANIGFTDVERNNFVLFGTNKKRVGIVEEVVKEDGPMGKGSQAIRIRGREAKAILGRRIITPASGYAQYTATGPAETVLKSLITAQVGSGASASRQISIVSVASDGAGGDTYDLGTRYTQMGYVVNDICESANMVLSTELSGSNLIFDTYFGLDRTASQSTNPRFILSTDFDTLQSGSVTDSDVQYTNLVIGAADGEGANRRVLAVYSGSEPTGLDRYESFIDARDLNNDSDLTDRCNSTLSAMGQTIFMDAEILTYSRYVLDTDYALGDYCTIKVAGVSQDRQITSVTESWGAEGYRIGVEF